MHYENGIIGLSLSLNAMRLLSKNLEYGEIKEIKRVIVMPSKKEELTPNFN